MQAQGEQAFQASPVKREHSKTHCTHNQLQGGMLSCVCVCGGVTPTNSLDNKHVHYSKSRAHTVNRGVSRKLLEKENLKQADPCYIQYFKQA